MFKPKRERPYLKVCTQCHGKGQLSYFNTLQEKKYSSCKKCTNGTSPNGGLGVTLKCPCQDKSARYDFLRATELRHIKGLEKPVVKGLKDFQAELGSEGTAIVLMCECGAWYLVADMGERRRIRGDEAANPGDKEHNKGIAAELAARGIARVLRPSPAAAAAAASGGGGGSGGGDGVVAGAIHGAVGRDAVMA